MTTLTPILCLGVNHRTAPIVLRERLNLTPKAVTAVFQANRTCGGDYEMSILSTCNRIELYATGMANFNNLQKLLSQATGVPKSEFAAHLYHYTDAEAIEHLCHVATGLDSMVLGEPQILGQVTQAYEIAQAYHTSGPILNALFQTAIRAGKRARTETAISRHSTSMSTTAVQLARQTMGTFINKQFVIVGAGEMAQLACKGLKAQGVTQLTIVNRTTARAEALAHYCDAQVGHLADLPQLLTIADAVFVATSAPDYILDLPLITAIMVQRPQRPLTLIDLSLPRNIDPAVSQLAQVNCFDIDSLQNSIDTALVQRQREIPHVQAIIAEEIAQFYLHLRQAAVRPLIIDWRQKAETIRQKELARTLRHLPDLDEATRQHIHHLSQSLVNKLLHEPTVRLRAEAGEGRAEPHAATIRYLFGLEEEVK